MLAEMLQGTGFDRVSLRCAQKDPSRANGHCVRVDVVAPHEAEPRADWTLRQLDDAIDWRFARY